MEKKLKIFWLIKILSTEQPSAFVSDHLTNFNISPEVAFCVLTLYMRLRKCRFIKGSKTCMSATFENKIYDAADIMGISKKQLIKYYNENLFDWEKQVGKVFPVRHY